jgi:hypothetical protein
MAGFIDHMTDAYLSSRSCWLTPLTHVPAQDASSTKLQLWLAGVDHPASGITNGDCLSGKACPPMPLSAPGDLYNLAVNEWAGISQVFALTGVYDHFNDECTGPLGGAAFDDQLAGLPNSSLSLVAHHVDGALTNGQREFSVLTASRWVVVGSPSITKIGPPSQCSHSHGLCTTSASTWCVDAGLYRIRLQDSCDSSVTFSLFLTHAALGESDGSPATDGTGGNRGADQVQAALASIFETDLSGEYAPILVGDFNGLPQPVDVALPELARGSFSDWGYDNTVVCAAGTDATATVVNFEPDMRVFIGQVGKASRFANLKGSFSPVRASVSLLTPPCGGPEQPPCGWTGDRAVPSIVHAVVGLGLQDTANPAPIPSETVQLLAASGNPLKRLTGSVHDLPETVPAGLAATVANLPLVGLRVIVSTGSDDLRGGDKDGDNAEVIVTLRSGSSVTVPNINYNREWKNDETDYVEVPLPANLKVSDIVNMDIHTHFQDGSIGGGPPAQSADNWNINQVILDAIVSCQPTCPAGACGGDGCGGSCPACAAGEVCSPTGACGVPSCPHGYHWGEVCTPGPQGGRPVCHPGCVADPCKPQCASGACGGDGCGGECPACASGVCFAGTCCQPKCPPGACGGDGCGGSCPECPTDEVCSSGSCSHPVCQSGYHWGEVCTQGPQDVKPVCTPGCVADPCKPQCPSGTCGADGCGGTCAACPSGVCFGGTCCQPKCPAGACGSDACGGSCPPCPTNDICSAGRCEQPRCPNGYHWGEVCTQGPHDAKPVCRPGCVANANAATQAKPARGAP